MAAIGSIPAKLVLTEAQAKILNTVKAAAGNVNSGGKQTTSEVASAFRIHMPALELAAGSAKATGDVRGAQYVAGKTKELADGLRSALKSAAEAPVGGKPDPKAPTAEDITTMAKQLKLLLVKAKIALLNPNAQHANAMSQKAAEAAVKTGETSLKALEAQIVGNRKSGIDIRA